ncbi:MAG TPA: hemolysin III family protein [Tepidisphaeraceae bacterium]|nr:hemolysin III family protein [Tepidisphaeraceae bacterium]
MHQELAGIRRLIKDPYCGLSHWVGAALSVAGLVALLVLAEGRPLHLVSFALYGSSLVLLYTASALAHSLHCSAEAEQRLDRFDFAAIFLLIAGTYTPLCLVNLRGPWGWSLLATEWTLAAVGILLVTLRPGRSERLRPLMYLVMGWLVALVPPAWAKLPAGAVAWLAAGGIAYSVGAAIYVFDRPHPWPGKFSAHDLWHTLVLVGSTCHFVLMVRYVA